AGAISSLLLIAADNADDIRVANWERATESNNDIGIALTVADIADKSVSALLNAASVASSRMRIQWQHSGSVDKRRTVLWDGALARDRNGYASLWIMNS